MHLQKLFLSIAGLMTFWSTLPAKAQESNVAYVQIAERPTNHWLIGSKDPQALLVAFSAWQDALDKDYYLLQRGNMDISQKSPTEKRYQKFCSQAFQPLLRHWPKEGMECAEFLGLTEQAKALLRLESKRQNQARQNMARYRKAITDTELRFQRVLAMELWQDAGNLALKLDQLQKQCRALALRSDSDEFQCEHSVGEESVFENFCTSHLPQISDVNRGLQEKCLAALGASNQSKEIEQIPNFKDQVFGVIVLRSYYETDTGVFPMNAGANAVRADLHSMIKGMGGKVTTDPQGQGTAVVSVEISGLQKEKDLETITPCRMEMKVKTNKTKRAFKGVREKITSPEAFTDDLREMSRSLFSQYLVNGTYAGAENAVK